MKTKAKTAKAHADSSRSAGYAPGDSVRVIDGKAHSGKVHRVVYQPQDNIVIVQLPDGMWPFELHEIERA